MHSHNSVVTQFGAGYGAGYGDGYCDGYGEGVGYGVGYGNGAGGAGDGAGYGAGYGDGYGEGYGEGRDVAYGDGDGYGSGDGFGDGYGYGYGMDAGSGYGYGGAGNGVSDDEATTTYGVIADCNILARSTAWGQLISVGCETHLIDTWTTEWRTIADAHDVEITEAEANTLLKKVIELFDGLP